MAAIVRRIAYLNRFSWTTLLILRWLIFCGLASFLGTLELQAQTISTALPQQAQDLKRLTIEELADFAVTTPARRTERLSDVAAAVSVIREDDLRRAGVTTLAEALRYADAVHAAQVYGPGWAISTRGFNIATANKLLVLIDGRTIYSPLFSGVFWDVQDVVLADIDRIEVIRGPGGTLWGANAVNGVVNIITKRAAETQGLSVTVTAGNEARLVSTARYGGTTGSISYRAYAKFRSLDDHVFKTGAPGQDDVQFGQTGFRLDSDDTAAAFWTIQGDAYGAREGLSDRGDTRVSGGNVLARWTRRRSASSQLQVQAYYDRTNRRVERQYRASRDTFDIDTQQQLQVASRHQLVLGAGFRASLGDDLGDGPGFFFDPQTRTSTLASAFIQDDIRLSNRVTLIGGTKIEHNDFTGVEIQPNLRVRVTPNGRQTVWAAVSRAVRMPTRFDTDLRILLPSGQLYITGSDAFESERVVAYEGGYRVRPVERLSIDVAAFANDWDRLRSSELPIVPGAPIVLGNGLNAAVSGVELSGLMALTPWWQLRGSYSHLREQFTADAGSHDPTLGVNEANDPSHLAMLRTSMDLPRRFELDLALRHASALPQPAVEAVTELSGRVGWHATPRWELSIGGDHLLHDRHEEFAAGTPRELFERGFYVRSAWRF